MENTGYPCPGCGAPADLASGCPGCGRPPYPPAAEVVTLDREIAGLTPRVEAARIAYQELAGRLSTARQRRAELAARIRLEIPAPRPVAPAPPAPVRPQPVPVPARPGGAETSTRAVQSLLFVLGGLLLGTAAVVFTAVAWAAFGVAGRALILLAFTALALAAPLVARARGLRGTAETFAAVGLLLVLLDGYAAWSVDLFGVAGWPGSRYAALVAGIGAAVAAGYARLSRLTVPWFAALLTAQPVLPLAAVAAEPSAAGWALVLTALALGDLVVVVALRGRVAPTGAVAGGRGVGFAGPPGDGAGAGGHEMGLAGPVGDGAGAGGHEMGLAGGGPVQPDPGVRAGGAAAGGGPAAAPPPGRPAAIVPARNAPSAVLAGWVLAWVGHGVALVLAAGCALVPLVLGRAAGTPLLAGGPLLVVALALFAGALAAGGRTHRLVGAGLLVPVVATALIRPVAALRPGLLLLAAGIVVVALAGAVRALPAGLRTGPRLGAFLVAAGLGQVATVLTGLVAAATAAAAFPAWRGGRTAEVPSWGWQLPVAVLLTAGAVALLAPRVARPLVGVVGGALAVLAAPAVTATPWPLVLVGDLAAATALLLVVVARPRRRNPTVVVTGLTAAVLLGHALLVGCAAPAGAGAVLAVLAVLGTVVAARGRRGRGAQPVVAGVALAVALLAVPAGVAVALLGLGAPAWWQLRAGTAAVAVPVVAVLAVRRHWPDLHGYASAGLAVALAAVGLGPLVVPGAEPVALYAAVGALLASAAGGGARPGPAPRAVGAALAGLALLVAAPTALAVLLDLPVRPWSGVPAVEPVPVAARAGLVLVLLGTLAAAYGRIVAADRRGAAEAPGWWLPVLAALSFGAVALPVLLAAAGAPWPVVPALVFGIGVAALLLAALPGPRPAAPLVLLPLGIALTAPGLGGLLATRAGTLAGLGVLVVAATVAGAAGRPAEVRIAGWLGAVAAATGFAVTAALAGGLPLRTAGFAVLAVAAVTLHATPTLRARTARAGGPAGAVALEAAAQAVALLALLLTGGTLRHAAAVCVLWGLAVAVRVLRRGETPAWRWGFAAVAGGSELLGGWLLLAAGGVAVLEAYTLPAAALALGAGLLALRSRPGLNSWLALGPGLGAALLPSLVSVLAAPDPQPARRLALGLVALGAVLGGAARRWQAPVLLGAATLVPLALHELARGWDLLPRWIFLGLGGLALIALAATYERRRRDVARLRAAVGGMR
ncbi:SCO7613 C-terminal domain-containing membrane protein [Micromonospora chersina]|uniref:SCO7613 C-terminal domain-containing membrane protein n=1 Tax=Micromonospora chersina TaxID=47854 RepID=UPI00371DABBC